MINKLKLARCAVNTAKQMVPSLLRRLGTCKQGGGGGEGDSRGMAVT